MSNGSSVALLEDVLGTVSAPAPRAPGDFEPDLLVNSDFDFASSPGRSGSLSSPSSPRVSLCNFALAIEGTSSGYEGSGS